MVQTELHVRLNIAFLRVEVREVLDVLDAHAGHLGGVLQRPRLNRFPHQLHLRAHRDALDGGNPAERRLDGLCQGHSAGSLLVPHHVGVDGNFLALSVGRSLGRLHAQVAHAQEFTVLLDQQGSLGVIAQEVGRFPALLEDLVDSAERQGAVGSRMHRDEPVGLRGHDAIGDIDHHKLGARIARLQEEVCELLLGHRRVAAPNYMVLGVNSVRAAIAIGAGSKHVGPGHRRSNIAVRQDTARAHDVQQASHNGALRGAAAESTGVAAAQEHGNGLRAELLGVALPFLGDLGNRLIPANALELATAALTYTTHGVLQSLGAVHAGGLDKALRADAVELGAVIEVTRSRAHHATVAHMDVQVAALTALGTARARVDLRLRNLYRLLARFRQRLLGGGAADERAGGRQRGRSLDEISARETHARCLFGHVLTPLSPSHVDEDVRQGGGGSRPRPREKSPLWTFRYCHYAEVRRLIAIRYA